MEAAMAVYYSEVNPIYRAYGGIIEFHRLYDKGIIKPDTMVPYDGELLPASDLVSPTWMKLVREAR